VSNTTVRTQWMDALLGTPNDEEHGGLDGYARAVAFVLYRHMTSDGQARPGTRAIARQAGAAHNVVERRVKALEEAGWLDIDRRPGTPNRYRATIPTAPPHGAVDRATPRRSSADLTAPPAPPHGAVDEASAPCEVVKAQGTAPPGGAKPKNQTTPSSSNAVNGQRKRVTREEIWKTMAERELGLQRQGNRTDLPPPGSRREIGYLASLREDFQRQHDARAQKLRDSLPAHDLERWIYALDPRLSEHHWGPAIAAQQLEHERNLAESLARVEAQTDDDRAAGARSLAEARAQLSERRAEQVPA
jgi:hypothetical protein